MRKQCFHCEAWESEDLAMGLCFHCGEWVCERCPYVCEDAEKGNGAIGGAKNQEYLELRENRKREMKHKGRIW